MNAPAAAVVPAPLIKNAADIEQPYTRWFLYGQSGSGKTHSAGTFPKPIFIVPSNENSIITLRGQDVPYIEVANRSDMLQAINWLRAQYDQMLALYDAGEDDKAEQAFPWQTVVVESLSHYCELLVEDIGQRGMKKMDMQAWGQLSSHLRTVHSQLSAMDVHVVYTSLESIDDNGVGRALMVGKNALMMPSACDIIAYCEAVPMPKGKEPIYRVHFRQYQRYPARSRFKAFPEHIDNFDFAKILDALGS